MMEAATVERPVEAPEPTPEPAPEAIALPKIDKRGVDRIEVAFSGAVRLDRSDPADVALIRQFELGKEVEVRVVATAAGKLHKISYDEDGFPGEVTLSAKAKITSVYRPAGADGAMARTGSNQTELTAAE